MPALSPGFTGGTLHDISGLCPVPLPHISSPIHKNNKAGSFIPLWPIEITAANHMMWADALSAGSIKCSTSFKSSIQAWLS